MFARLFKRNTAVKLLLVLFAGAALILFFHSYRNPDAARKILLPGGGGNHTLILREDGFSPRELTIGKGDTVTFTTKRSTSFWPASDIHPTHTIYPEFDPRKPIGPQERWSFQFEKVGQWRYHDHLAPYFTGTIIVTDAQVEAAHRDPCRKKTESSKLQCWQAEIESALDEKGIGEAFQVLAARYAAEPLFAENCHGFVHALGEAAFAKFKRGEPFALPPEAAYCSYGFYHGFMGTLLETTGDLAEARAFCDQVEGNRSESGPGARNACLHGLGHGLVNTEDPRLRGNAQGLVDPALAICDGLAKTELDRYLCASGVFNSFEILSTAGSFGLSVNRDDPFGVCRRQPARFQNACYTNMVPALFPLTSRNFMQSATLVNVIPDDRYAADAIMALSAEFVKFYRFTGILMDVLLGECRSLPQRLHPPCIRGIPLGFMKHGEPGSEHLQALEFCRSPALNPKEVETCLQGLLGNDIFALYPPAKARQICASLAPDERVFCHK